MKTDDELIAEFHGATQAKNWQGKDGWKHPTYEHDQWSNRIQSYFTTDVLTEYELRQLSLTWDKIN